MASSPFRLRRYSSESQQSQQDLTPSGIPSPPTSERHRCSQCASSFLRLEHLKRHERDHWDSKPFVCSLCGKGFTRSDTLKRHENVHAAVSSDGEGGPSVLTRSHRGRYFRACHNCAQARARCSGEDVCSRCLSKSMICEYPEKRQRSGQSSPARNDFAQQDPTWRLGDLSFSATSPQHFMLDTDNLSSYSSSSDNFPHPINTYGLGHGSDIANLSPRSESMPFEMNYDQVPPLMPPHSGGLISPDIDSNFDLNQSLPPQPPPAMDLSMGDVNSSSINWLPTAFNDELAYAAASGFGMPLQAQNPKMPYPGPNDGMPLTPIPGMDFQPGGHTEGRRGSHSPGSAGSGNSSVESTGKYYSTSFDGARIPFVRGTKRRRSFNVANATEPKQSLFREQSGGFSFPEVAVPMDTLPPVQPGGPAMGLKAYDRIADAFRQVCHGLGTTFGPFKTLAVPSPAQLNYFVQLYYENFHPILPILHLPTLQFNEDEWVLGLAVATIGCRYVESEELLGFVRPITEFLRRVIIISIEHHPPRQMPLGVLQAVLLNYINMLYSESTRFSDSALNDFSRLVEAVRTWKLLPSMESTPQSWSEWVRAEARIRLGYSIFFLDCMMAYQMDQKPFLTMDDMHTGLPCNEDLWAAKNEDEWANLRRITEPNPPISEAVHMCFVRKEVKPDLGEFSRIVLLQGIYHEIWSIARYQRRSLASWIPSAEDGMDRIASEHQERPQNVADSSTYIPENPIYSKWRNAACDCLDILHWAANATIAQQSGSEHGTVCHLHLSRVILLSPISEIISLAKSMATSDRRTLPQLTKFESKVFLWVQKDQHKARLAMIHAGAIFWHLRRFSKAAFYEPNAVFLATLVMWAYASYTALTTNTSLARTDSLSGSESPGPSPPNNNNDTSPAMTFDSMTTNSDYDSELQHNHPTFIRLDRPNDDEMVQLFVRIGHPSRMKAHVSGVGNLLSPAGPERVLREGCKVLSRMTLTWGCATEYVKLLSNMMEMVSSVRERAAATTTGAAGGGAAVGNINGS